MKKTISILLAVSLIFSAFAAICVNAADTKIISGSASTKIEFEKYTDKKIKSVAGASGGKVVAEAAGSETPVISIPVTFEKSGRYNIKYVTTKKDSSLSKISFSLDLKSAFPIPGDNAKSGEKLAYSAESGQQMYLFEEKSVWIDANTYDLKVNIDASNGKYNYALDYIEFCPTPVPEISATEKTRIELDEYSKAGIYGWDRGVETNSSASGGQMVNKGYQTLDPDFSFDVKVLKSGDYNVNAVIGEKMGKSYLSAVRIKLGDFEINNTEKAAESLGYGWESMPAALYKKDNVHIEKGDYKLEVIVDLVTNQEVTHKYVYDYIEFIPVNISDEKEDDTPIDTSVTYSVRFNTNGAGIIPAKSVKGGDSVKEPTAPEKSGYEFGGWYTDSSFNKVYDFASKVTKNITLYAKWNVKSVTPEPVPWKNPFGDVRENDWYYKSVEYVHNNGLMNGVSESLFGPNSDVTRAMFVTVLYRIENQPEASASTFSDVESGSYYEKAVAWGYENKIVNGVSDTEFAPHNNITREQMAAMMFRYAQYKGIDTSVGENTNILSYNDFNVISEYAISAIQWACGAHIMNGETESTFNPKNISTRAQAATVFMRVVEACK